MPTDWVKQNVLEAVAQIRQFVTGLNTAGGLVASGLDAPDLTALDALADTMETTHTAKTNAEAAYRAAVDADQAAYLAGTSELRRLGRAANDNQTMTDAFRAAAGMTIRDTEPTPGALPTIDDVAVVGRPSGNNFVDWGTPAGVAAGIVWEVYSSLGESGEWTLVGASSRTDFLHEGAGAGVHRLYRVVAKRGNLRGEPSNEAAVYG